MLCIFKLTFYADYFSKLAFNILKLCQLSQISQNVTLIILPTFYLNLTCSAVLKLACYADYISKLIFYFLKLCHLSQISDLNNLPNFYLISTCSVILKLADLQTIFHSLFFTFSTWSNFNLIILHIFYLNLTSSAVLKQVIFTLDILFCARETLLPQVWNL